MTVNLEQTFRWFGPSDPVTLPAIGQTGATGIVSALHHVPCGDAWTKQEIHQRKELIDRAGFRWSVVESVNIHESIKTGASQRDQFIGNYIETLKNLSAVGIEVVCYNFMPVLDWTRTHLDYRLSNGASALRYHAPALAAFDLYILEREDACTQYTPAQQLVAKNYLDDLDESQRQMLTNTILAGLPGTDEVFTVAEFKSYLERYRGMDEQKLKDNLSYFLNAIIPHAEQLGIRMCIHPDDPPFAILGLPRIVKNEQDLSDIVGMCHSPANGITLCTGSLGANPANDIPGIVDRLGQHIHFLHLRNVCRQSDGSFYEAEHLEGSTDMFEVMKAVIIEQNKRQRGGRKDISIPVRPDHGHKILDDFNYNTYPGYSVTGRLKGLAELRGLELGIRRMVENHHIL